jgi:hypothetical protein
MGWGMGLKALLVSLGTLGLLASPKVEAQCLEHKINYEQKGSQYDWTMEWISTQPFSSYETFFSSAAGSILEEHSEVVQNMWWRKVGPNVGTLEAWLLVDSGISKQKKYFLKDCKLDRNSVFCQLNTLVGGAGDRIHWAWSKLLCQRPQSQSQKMICKYQEKGSVKGIGPFASAQKISVAINTQSIKDTIRLAIAAEHGPAKVGAVFSSARRTADSFWNQGQARLRAGQQNFTIRAQHDCQ